jgi:galactofuranosylgalactofuranosylrhamnosyl-N-acetylglucosaminyl-diphospho-decaprenol beta-1,5/1,6-galactofuranosyltransferase
MSILGRLRLPATDAALELYVQSAQPITLSQDDGDRAIYLGQGDQISFNTYFNSLYETFYAQYTTISSVYYQLHLDGSFTLSLYREEAHHSPRQLLHCQSLTDCQRSSPVRVEIPGFAGETVGRIYLELVCTSDRGTVRESWIVTDEVPQQTVHLGIVSCTYKKENYIQKTVNTILQDVALRDKALQVFVVDNGQTLAPDTFQDDRVQIIPNRNLGGSGGFTRGLVEAMIGDRATHLLVMDDDVELDSEVIYKLISLYEYAKSDFAVSGAMLDLYKKHLLFEAGANYARSIFRDGFEPFELLPLKTDLDLTETASLNTLLVEDKIDYGGFWFFAFPRKFVDEIGLPLPFFIKGDDIEFGLRISQKLQQKIIAFPAIAVWHEPFYAKFPIWDSYYYFRNFLAIHAIHGSLSYLKVVQDFTMRLIYILLFFDYNSAGMLVRAFEDYLKGPEFIKQQDAEKYHLDIVKLSRSHQNQSIDCTFQPTQIPEVPKAGLWRKIASFLTLNGHFLPNFLIQSEPQLIWYAPGFPGQRSRALARKKIHIFKSKMACVYQYEMDKPSGFKILRDWVRLVWRGLSRWAGVNAAWKNAAPEFVSLGFWKDYLRLS